MFLKNNFDSVIPPMDLTVDDFTLIALVTREIKAYISSLESLRHALTLYLTGFYFGMYLRGQIKVL